MFANNTTKSNRLKLLIVLLIVFGALFFVTNVSLATPLILSHSGDAIDGEPLTITGSGFGTSTLNIEWLGGQDGVIEKGAAGTAVNATLPLGWSADTTNTSRQSPVYSSTESHSGTKSIKAYTPVDSQYTSGIVWDSGAEGFTSVYATWWTKVTDPGFAKQTLFSLTHNGTTANVILSASAKYSSSVAVGKKVKIYGAVNPEYNGVFTIASVADNTHFTYNMSSIPAGNESLPPAVIYGEFFSSSEMGQIKFFRVTPGTGPGGLYADWQNVWNINDQCGPDENGTPSFLLGVPYLGNYCLTGETYDENCYVGYHGYERSQGIVEGYWQRVEIWSVQSTPGLQDGTINVKIHRQTSTPQSYADWDGNVRTRSFTDDMWRYVIWTNYIGNYIDYANIYLDDLYIQSGTQARVEICDSKIWSDRKHCEIQPPLAWTDNSVTIKANRGSFASGQQAYLYVIDSSGNVDSTGHSLIFSAEITPPAAPSGLKIQ